MAFLCFWRGSHNQGGAQMTDIKVKQLIERLRQRSNSNYILMSDPPKPAPDADCHMAADLLQEALAFKQEVSDAVEEYYSRPYDFPAISQSFIISKPKPDPLVEAAEKLGWIDAGELRAALDALGFEIREKE
jgi:hypothetical protein